MRFNRHSRVTRQLILIKTICYLKKMLRTQTRHILFIYKRFYVFVEDLMPLTNEVSMATVWNFVFVSVCTERGICPLHVPQQGRICNSNFDWVHFTLFSLPDIFNFNTMSPDYAYMNQIIVDDIFFEKFSFNTRHMKMFSPKCPTFFHVSVYQFIHFQAWSAALILTVKTTGPVSMGCVGVRLASPETPVRQQVSWPFWCRICQRKQKNVFAFFAISQYRGSKLEWFKIKKKY